MFSDLNAHLYLYDFMPVAQMTLGVSPVSHNDENFFTHLAWLTVECHILVVELDIEGCPEHIQVRATRRFLVVDGLDGYPVYRLELSGQQVAKRANVLRQVRVVGGNIKG